MATVEHDGATAMTVAPLLEVRDLQVHATAQGTFSTIVSGVSFHVREGETLGIVGESGSGKSVTAKSIAGLLSPNLLATGEIRFEGQDVIGLGERARARLRGRDIGLLFQDPFTMLNPVLRVGDQILESARDDAGRRLHRDAAREEAGRRLAEVGIRDASVADRYPFQLSGGMRQRVGIAAALAADPRLLIADEPSTALDVTTQNEILELLASLQRRRGMAVILITHDLRVAFSVCDRVVVMYAGRCLEAGSAGELESSPRHPYTLGLLLSEPALGHRAERLAAIPGAVPKPDAVAGICAFADRCRWSAPVCREGEPELRALGGGRATVCVRVDEIVGEMSAAGCERISVAAESRLDVQTAPPVLTIEGLVKRFPGARRGGDVAAVGGVSLEVRAGEAVGLVGGSGSGKTTLARCVVGLETISEGRMVLDGAEYLGGQAPTRDLAAQRRRSVQMVFQDPYSSLNPRRTVGSTLAEALRLARPRPDDLDAAVEALLTQVGLSAQYVRRRPSRLSGGERQRVAIARALALKPKLLVCDEPVSALDVSVQAQILNLLNDLRAELGIGYLFITHDLAVVRQVADRLYVMHEGVIVEDGPVETILDRPRHDYTRRLIASVPSREQRVI